MTLDRSDILAEYAPGNFADLLNKDDFYRQYEAVWGPLEGRIRDDALLVVNWLEGTKLCYERVSFLEPDRLWRKIARESARTCVWVNVNPFNPETITARGSKSDVLTVGNLAADFDTHEGYHKKDDGSISHEQALEAIHTLLEITPPAVVIHSGGGMHAWVSVEEDMRIDDPILRRWKQLTDGLGGDTSVSGDPARILRPAGSLNHKLRNAVYGRGENWGDGTRSNEGWDEETGRPTWRGTPVDPNPSTAYIVDELSTEV